MQVLLLRVDVEPEDLLSRLRAHSIPGLGISLARIARVPFHPQWNCSSKEYRYRLLLHPTGPVGWEKYSWRPSEHPRIAGRPVGPERLADILREYVGTREFAAFHESSSPVRARTIESAELTESGKGLFEICIRGDRFARYLVRFLVGTAVAAAAVAIPRERVTLAIETGERIHGLRAPAQGLILWEVRYPADRDPFSPLDRQAPPGLPNSPPFQELCEPA
jgi:tRNA pseudouridine38-40 synthase